MNNELCNEWSLNVGYDSQQKYFFNVQALNYTSKTTVIQSNTMQYYK